MPEFLEPHTGDTSNRTKRGAPQPESSFPQCHSSFIARAVVGDGSPGIAAALAWNFKPKTPWGYEFSRLFGLGGSDR